MIVAGSTMRGEEAAVLRAFARIKATTPGALADPRAAPARAVRRSRAARARRGFVTARRSELPIDAEPRADVVVLDTSASWRSSIRSRPRCSSAAAWPTTAATTSSSRRSSASRSCSVRTCRTSRRSPTRFVANGAAIQVQSERELDEALLDAGHRSGAPRAARRGGARAGRSQPRREGQDARRDRRAAAAGRRGRRRRPSLPTGALIRDVLSSVYGAAAAWRRRWYARDPSRRQRRSTRPVISVGNLRVGGSGKTPVVAHIARLLLDAAASGRRS